MGAPVKTWLAAGVLLLLAAFVMASVVGIDLVRQTSSTKQPIVDGTTAHVQAPADDRRMVWSRDDRPRDLECRVVDRRTGERMALHSAGNTNNDGADGHWYGLVWFRTGSGRLDVTCSASPGTTLAVWNAFDSRWFVGLMVRLFVWPGLVALVGLLCGLRAYLVWRRGRRVAPG